MNDSQCTEIMNNDYHVDVAKTIYEQFGGHHSMAIISGRSIAATKENNGTLQFSHMSGRTDNGDIVNRTKISLNEFDEYEMSFFNDCQGVHIKVKTLPSVPADNLVSIFEEETGLALSL